MARVLHVLSQRPGRTGSGTMLEALVRQAARAGWEQAAAVGVPAGSDDVARLESQGTSVFPVTFAPDGTSRNSTAGSTSQVPMVDFLVPGMSDVMPYPSSRFSRLRAPELAAYRRVWTDHLREVITDFQPDLVHANHVWIVSSIIKDATPHVPVVTQCHATGLRQMELCPHIVADVVRGVRRNDRFVALHAQHVEELSRILDLRPEPRMRSVGAAYREDIFCARGETAEVGDGRPRLLYAGKYAGPKGLPQLLDAFERLRETRPGLTFHVAGSGAGREAEVLQERMGRIGGVVLHGALTQEELASLMRACDVFVLPSLYEGVPLVLIEALACGCRLAATALPGVMAEIAPRIGDALVSIPVPPLDGVDRLAPTAAPAFVGDIAAALSAALDRGPVRDAVSGELPRGVFAALEHFTWASLFERIGAVWAEAMGGA